MTRQCLQLRIAPEWPPSCGRASAGTERTDALVECSGLKAEPCELGSANHHNSRPIRVGLLPPRDVGLRHGRAEKHRSDAHPSARSLQALNHLGRGKPADLRVCPRFHLERGMADAEALFQL